MKYPCIEATIETPCKGGGLIRLWIERPTMLTAKEQTEISSLIWSYHGGWVCGFEDLVGELTEKIPGLSAAQIVMDTDSEQMARSVGQVVYVKDFATDPHG